MPLWKVELIFYHFSNKYAAFEKPQAVISDEPESNEQTNGVGVGGSIQLSNYESSSSGVTKSGIRAHLYLCPCVCEEAIMYNTKSN